MLTWGGQMTDDFPLLRLSSQAITFKLYYIAVIGRAVRLFID